MSFQQPVFKTVWHMSPSAIPINNKIIKIKFANVNIIIKLAKVKLYIYIYIYSIAGQLFTIMSV